MLNSVYSLNKRSALAVGSAITASVLLLAAAIRTIFASYWALLPSAHPFNVLPTLGAIAIVASFLGWYQYRAAAKVCFKPNRLPPSWWGFCIISGVLLAIVMFYCNGFILAKLESAAGLNAQRAYTHYWLAAIVVSVLLAPLLEEFLYRNLLIQYYFSNLPGNWAIGLSSLMFALIHGTVQSGLNAFIIGLILAWVMKKTRSLLSVTLIHGSYNASVILLLNRYEEITWPILALSFAITAIALVVLFRFASVAKTLR